MMAGGSFGAAWQGFAVAARNWSARTGAARQQARASEVMEGHAALQVAVGALRTTSASLANRLQAPAPAAARPNRPPASLTGFLPALGSLSTLQATRAVNEGVSTVRRSAGSVGLDVTSPEAASTLQGTAAIGLDVTTPEAPSVLLSAAEANAAATSYGVVQAAFTRGGAPQGSLGRLSGVYAGTGAASTATSLRLRISSPDAVIGAAPTAVSFRVFDQAGTSVGSFTGLVTAGESISLGPDIGLSLSFTAGSILRNAETTFSVSNTTPTDVDPDAAFNDANVNLRPRFENGAQVTAGSFTVNGTRVDVLAGDTIHTVLSRLNSTVAGVEASFSGDRVRLQTTGASEDALVLGNDTSGFLSALKLAGAVTTPGHVRDDRQTLSRTAALAGVTAGSFSVNGAVITVDPAADTLQAVLDRIDAAGAGVTAAYDAAEDRVRLVSAANSEDDIVLAGDTTGLLAALNLAGAATARGNLQDDTQRLAAVSALAGVTAGSFRVNGQTIAVDPGTDTLQAILARVNAAGAGVTASYDAVLDEVLFTPDTTGASLVLEEDTSGFLAAVGVAQGAAGTAVNPDAAFNGTGLSAPFFDEGRAVGAGGFRVNGVSIGVAADDTLQAVLDRITQSSAGVTAVFDAATERVTLVAKAVGSSPIEVGEDTSGFLAAVKLDGTAASVPGQGGLGAMLASQPALAGVGAGVITVNGRTVTVNPGTQSLEGVAAALDGLEGVRFTLEAATGRVRLEAERGWDPLDVTDTSGLLAALGMASGRVEATTGRAGPAVWPAPAASRPAVGAAEARTLAEEVAGVLGDLNDAMGWIASASDAAAAYQNDVFAAVRGAVAGWGSRAVALEETDGWLQVGADAVGLEMALRTDARALADFLGGEGGLVTALEAVMQAYGRNAEAMRAPSAYALAQARRAYGF